MILARPFGLVAAVALAVALLFAGCAAEEPPDASATGDAPGDESPAPSSPASQFTGTIGGDAQLEGGCLWLDTDDERYELRLPDSHTVDRGALTITGPQGDVFSTGDRVTVTGHVNRDMVSVCQVGPILEVQELSAS